MNSIKLMRLPLLALLQDIANGFPPQYGAVVFDDDVSTSIVSAAFGGFGAAYNAGALDLPDGQTSSVVYSLLSATPQGRWASYTAVLTWTQALTQVV